MGGGTHPDPTGTLGSLDDRILSVLHDLHGRVAFNGLRRKLGAHPESLARALRRLEREGLVEREDGGYRSLSDGGASPTPVAEELHSIARIELPRELDAGTVFARLAGRWFGSLRWVGVVEQPGRRLLAWARRDGYGQVLLGVHRGVLRVYVPAPAASGDEAETEALAYELLVQAVGIVHPSPSARGVALFRLGPERAPLDRRDN